MFMFNASRPEQNGRHFAEEIVKCTFMNENGGPIDNKCVVLWSGNGLARVGPKQWLITHFTDAYGLLDPNEL